MNMQIQLPTKKGQPNTNPTIEFSQLVVVGANGSGKTRMGSQIEKSYPQITHRVSAQKSLSFPANVSPTSKDRAQIAFKNGTYYGHIDIQNQLSNAHHKLTNRWGGNYNTSLLNDYEQLLVLLHTEEYEESLSYKEGRIERPITKLDIVQKIWESVLPHRKLFKSAGTIQTFPAGQENNKYNASEMSDGERVIFYLIGEIVCAQPNSIIILDEPEMHIHKSLVKSLFDLIEIERQDCSFVYLTHDLDFAFSRQNATKIWAKSYLGNDVWDYEILDENMPISEQLYLEVLGSRKPVLFLEGDNSSIDYELYEQVYSDYTIKPLGSCEKVIQSVRTLNEQKTFHHVQSFGIIDRDRRQSSDITFLNSKDIWVLDVAEAENLLLLEGIVKAVAMHMGKDPNYVFANVSDNIIAFFGIKLESQILLHFKELLKKDLLRVTNYSSSDINDVIVEIDGTYGSIDKMEIYNKIRVEFTNAIVNRDYNAILRLLNFKNALIPHSRVCELTGIKNKEEFLRLVVTLLKKKDVISESIKAEISNKVIKGIM